MHQWKTLRKNRDMKLFNANNLMRIRVNQMYKKIHLSLVLYGSKMSASLMMGFLMLKSLPNPTRFKQKSYITQDNDN